MLRALNFARTENMRQYHARTMSQQGQLSNDYEIILNLLF